MARVFSAVDVESEELVRELERVRDILDLGFNTVPGDRMHITLQFFENLEGEELEEVKSALDSVSTGPFNVEVRGLGAFPSTDYIRVVWAGAESDRLQGLHGQVSSHSVESSNNHDFEPHVTLARVKDLSASKKRKLQKSLEEFGGHRFGTLEVDSVRLYESQLTGENSRYKLIGEKKL